MKTVSETPQILTNALIYTLITHLELTQTAVKPTALTAPTLAENARQLGIWRQILSQRLAASAAKTTLKGSQTNQVGRRPVLYAVTIDGGHPVFVPGAAALATYLGRRNAASLRVQLSRAQHWMQILRPMPGGHTALIEITKASAGEAERYWATGEHKMPAPLAKPRAPRNTEPSPKQKRAAAVDPELAAEIERVRRAGQG